MQYEYRVREVPMNETRDVLPDNEMTNWLNEFGDEGWDLAYILPGGRFVFRRPRDDAKLR
jgi:hypothetical protein